MLKVDVTKLRGYGKDTIMLSLVWKICEVCSARLNVTVDDMPTVFGDTVIYELTIGAGPVVWPLTAETKPC